MAGAVDAVEMTSWQFAYKGIGPYALSDWYRFLNCGYLMPAVGGTDKMSALTAVGTIRTYARLASDEPFTYQGWMAAVRRGETFVTYGPLLDMAVEGQPMGSRLQLPRGGGRIEIVWRLESVTTRMTRVDLIVNGVVRESQAVGPAQAAGSWSVVVEQSTWLALLVRGQSAEQPEMIAAHSSPVMVMIEGSALLVAADALTVLDQIEGTLAYLDTISTRADAEAYRRVRLSLTATHQRLHNRMHQQGIGHSHTVAEQHPEHER